MITTSSSYKELPDNHGGKFLVVYESKSTRLILNIWESPGGQLVALDDEWFLSYSEAQVDPVPELLQHYE